MLIRPFQIKVCRPPLPGLEHRSVAHAGLEPDIEDVPLFLECRSATCRTGGCGRKQVGCRSLEPDIRPLGLHEIRDMINHLWISKHRATPRACKSGNRDSPHTLTRQTPIGAVLDHPVDPIAAKCWNPADPLNL